jgi:lipid II:glycine glycyltransferase (peptidoglycan interpeptide bridge formation enzyme)
MQTYEWGEFKENTGWKAFRVAVEEAGQIVAGAQVLVKPLPFKLSSLAYVPRGPLVDWRNENAAKKLLATIHDIAHKERSFVLKIEPALPHSPDLVSELVAHGFSPSQYCNQPRCSMVIDLEPELETIMARMHKSTRYNIRYANRKGVVIHEGSADDLPTFFGLLQLRAKRGGFPTRTFDYYASEWDTLARHSRMKLFVASHNEEVLAMRMLANFGGKAATFHSGHLDNHRNLKPNELLMWECIRWAKAQGCQKYDVWGVPDEIGEMLKRGEPLPNNNNGRDNNGGLWGAYHFKRGFGGEFVYYVGAYDYVYTRPLYQLMDKAVLQLGSLDKLAQLGDRLKF